MIELSLTSRQVIRFGRLNAKRIAKLVFFSKYISSGCYWHYGPYHDLVNSLVSSKVAEAPGAKRHYIFGSNIAEKLNNLEI